MRETLQRSIAEDEIRLGEEVRLRAEVARQQLERQNAINLLAGEVAAREEGLQQAKAQDERWCRQQELLHRVEICREKNEQRKRQRRSPTPPLDVPEKWLDDVRSSTIG